MTFPRFSPSEFARRGRLARGLMERQDLRALILFGNSGINRHNQANVYWLSNYLDLHHNYLVVPLDGEPVLLVGLINHVPNARALSVIPDTRWGTYEPARELAARLDQMGIGRGRVGLVGINATFGMGMPYQHFMDLRQACPEIEWIDVTRVFARLRAVKSEEEFVWLERAAAYTDATLYALESQVRPGMTEHELIAIIEGAYRAEGGQPHIAFLASMPMQAPTACVPAQNVSGRVIEQGDVIILEISASYGGYSGQVHRPIAVGSEPTIEWKKMFDVGVQSFDRICAAIRPDASEADVIRAAAVLGENGYQIYDDLIHGYGVDIHPPLIDRTCCAYWENKTREIPAGRNHMAETDLDGYPRRINVAERCPEPGLHPPGPAASLNQRI